MANRVMFLHSDQRCSRGSTFLFFARREACWAREQKKITQSIKSIRSSQFSNPTALWHYFAKGTEVIPGWSFAEVSGAAFASAKAPGTWVGSWNPIRVLQRVFYTGRVRPWASELTQRIPEQALHLYARSGGCGLFSLWKYLAKQYRTKKPGHVWLDAGVQISATPKQIKAFNTSRAFRYYLDPALFSVYGALGLKLISKD